MTHEEKVNWMAIWAAKNGCALELNGEVGFGRECVGIIANDLYPDYDEDVWVPEEAYYKHPCVAVLGRGEWAEAQLFEWLQWFDEHGFTVEKGVQAVDPSLGALAYLLNKHKYARMVER